MNHTRITTQSITGKEVKLFQKLVSLVESISTLLVTGKVQDVTSRHLVQISGIEKSFNTGVTHFNVLFVNLGSKIRRFCSCSHVRVPHLVAKSFVDSCQVDIGQVDNCPLTPVHCL